MGVVLLMALLTTGVALAMASSLRRAELEDAVLCWKRFDAAAREQVRHEGRTAIIEVRDSGTRLVRRFGGGDEVVVATLPEGFRARDVRTRDGRFSPESFDFRVSPDGFAPSYAVCIEGRGRRTWLLVSGLTGEAVTTENEVAIEQRFETMRPARDDAD
jgi:hypothetical protein